jgi:hypothetical protein
VVVVPDAVAVDVLLVVQRRQEDVVAKGRVTRVVAEVLRVILPEAGDFLVGERGPPGELFRTLERRRAVVDQTPDKSGCPSAVRGGVYALVDGVADWPKTATDPSATTAPDTARAVNSVKHRRPI